MIQYLHFLNIAWKMLLFFAVRPHYWERMSLVYKEELQEEKGKQNKKDLRLHDLGFGMSKEGTGRKL